MVIELKSSSASPESAYCLQIYKLGGTGEGNIVFVCFSFVFVFIVRVCVFGGFLVFFVVCSYVYLFLYMCLRPGNTYINHH